MMPAHYIREAELTFDGLTARELDILKIGYASGIHQANNEAQPKLSDLEIRIGKVQGLINQASEALYKPSF